MSKKLHEILETSTGYLLVVLSLPFILGLLILYWLVDLLDYLLEG
jgi:hypothetical protein